MNIDEYERGGRALYTEFAQAVAAILRAAIAERGEMHLLEIQRRAKDVGSLRTKLAKAEAPTDAEIGAVAKDVAGCRLIFYTNGDVSRFGQSGILSDNFEIDHERSKIHYPENSDDGAEFFISENWVVRLNDTRKALPEFRRFGDMACEVQIQTILDHGWAEMAHDTIYKPMADKGFGANAIEGMRRRLRKVMRDYLQPAGYEFEKIASDYARLRDGKAMFDEDALKLIRDCTDRNGLHDAIERFSAYVLPHYDDFGARAGEIIDTLVDAAVRAMAMPDVPHRTYYGEYPGWKADALVAQICRVLESGYLLYADPPRIFDGLLAMRRAATGDAEKKSIDQLAKRFAQHDMRAWKRVGAGLQRFIVDRIAGLDDPSLVAAAESAIGMLREALSSTVSGTTASADSVTLHSGSVAASDALKAMRADALTQLKRIHALAGADIQAKARSAMLAAGDTPNQAGYSDALGVILLTDLVDVVRFFATVVPTLGLEAKRKLEASLFRQYYRYHVLPPSMEDNEALGAAQAELLDAIAACRALIDADADLARYRWLVGYDSVSQAMWAEASYDRESCKIEAGAAIEAMVASIDDDNEADWLNRLERYVETESNDLAMFLGLQAFIKRLAAVQPAILLGWLPSLGARLAHWLPGMLHGLAEAGQGDKIDPVIEQWVGEGKHLAAIAWYLQHAEMFRYDLLETITAKALAAKDDHVLSNVAYAAARQSAAHPDGLFDKIFLPAATALSARGDYSWTGHMLAWKDLALLKDLGKEPIDALLALLVELPTLDHGGEDLLAILAEQDVEAVLELIHARFAREGKGFDTRYTDLPYGLHALRAPLVAAPDKVVATARTWFGAAPELAEYRGGRLIAELFPNLEHPLYPLLHNHVLDGRDGIAFVLSVLRAYEGQEFLHPLLREIVAMLEPGDELLRSVELVIIATGVLTGEHGSVEAQAARQALVGGWEKDERERVRAFAAAFVKSGQNSLAWERRRADQRLAMRKIDWGD